MLNLKKRLNQQSLSEIWHIISIYLCFLSPALPDLVGLRAGREKSKFSGRRFSTDICSSVWLHGPRRVLEGQTMLEAKNTFCPLILAPRGLLHSDVCLPASTPASGPANWRAAICSTWGYTWDHMGLQLPYHTGACLQPGEDQMEQTIPMWGRLTRRCWGLGVRRMADYKHLNNNTTTHADSFPPGRQRKENISGKDKPEEYYGVGVSLVF